MKLLLTLIASLALAASSAVASEGGCGGGSCGGKDKGKKSDKPAGGETYQSAEVCLS